MRTQQNKYAQEDHVNKIMSYIDNFLTAELMMVIPEKLEDNPKRKVSKDIIAKSSEMNDELMKTSFNISRHSANKERYISCDFFNMAVIFGVIKISLEEVYACQNHNCNNNKLKSIFLKLYTEYSNLYVKVEACRKSLK